MESIHVSTTAGVFAVVGRIHADRPRPTLMAVNASFSPPGYMHEYVDQFPDANVLIVNVPGRASAYAPNSDLNALTRGLEEVARVLAKDSPLVLFAASTGNLLTLGASLPNLVRTISLEPFFVTQDLWPLFAWLRQYLARNGEDSGVMAYISTMYGFSSQAIENRDYRALRDGISTPTDVVCGTVELLPPRRLESWPSLTAEEDREALRRNPMVSFYEGPPGTGHEFGSRNAGVDLVQRLLQTALADAAKLCA
jgi:hypothetical protein